MGMTGGPGAQCRGWGELQREPWGGPLLRPPGVPASSVTGDRESRAQAQQGERLRGWTPAAACRLVGHTQERGRPPRDGRQTTWQSCPRSREPGAQPRRASLRRHPRAARRKRVGGLRGQGVQPPDPGGLPTETAWTGKQGKRSVQKLPGVTSRNTSACALAAHSAKKQRLGLGTQLCTLLSSI